MNISNEKFKLEQNIQKLIAEFEESTGATVEDIYCVKQTVYKTEWQNTQRMTREVHLKVSA